MKVLILGGGQLARMLAISARSLNIETMCVDPKKDACAAGVSEHIVAAFDDLDTIMPLIEDVDVVTIETENIPVQAARAFNELKTFYPSLQALEITQDRVLEKTFLADLHIPTAEFAEVTSAQELKTACETMGLPVVVKTCRFGYDGKGQVMVSKNSHMADAWSALERKRLIVEKFVEFEREVSLVCVRDKEGKTGFYPLVENVHQDGILQSSTAPFEDEALQQQAEDYAEGILNKLEYVGVMTIEFFQTQNGLLVNEIAPRVHNSGHWTIEGAQTSQFSNHMRAITGMPLGSTNALGFSFMQNCIGEMPPVSAWVQMAGVHYHSYNKAPRPQRKVGHVTMVAQNRETFERNKSKLMRKI